MLAKLRSAANRLMLWVIAAVITLAVLFVSVLLYKWWVFEPEPPTAATCEALQVLPLRANDQSAVAAEIQVYQCQRGKREQWQGFEVWLRQPLSNDWQRIATAERGQCLTVSLAKHGQLIIHHSHSRGDLQLAKSSVIYRNEQGQPFTLAVSSERTDDCPLP
ncbi:MAG: hypothetical protein R3273_03685 [Pseudidiomarina maritima]|nr:hypothetical protein [Pseudidiomarina maritima]